MLINIINNPTSHNKSSLQMSGNSHPLVQEIKPKAHTRLDDRRAYHDPDVPDTDTAAYQWILMELQIREHKAWIEKLNRAKKANSNMQRRVKQSRISSNNYHDNLDNCTHLLCDSGNIKHPALRGRSHMSQLISNFYDKGEGRLANV